MSVKLNYILLLFGDNPVSYNACAALYNSNILTIAHLPSSSQTINNLSKKFHHLSQSKYDWDQDQYVSELIELLKTTPCRKKILVQLTNDHSIEFWIKHSKSLGPYCTINYPHIETIYNKFQFSHALNNKVPLIPCSTNNEFPYVVKPAIKGHFREPSLEKQFQKQFGQKFFKVNNKEDESKLSQYESNDLIKQTYLNHNDFKELSWVGYRNADNTYAFQLNHLKRNHNDRISELSVSEVSKQVSVIADSVLKTFEYNGICDIQFFYNVETKEYIVNEMNPRLWCGHEILLLNNLNLVKKMAYDYYQLESSAINMTLKKPCRKWYSWLYIESIKDYYGFQPNEFYQLESDSVLFRLAAFSFGLIKSLVNLITHGRAK